MACFERVATGLPNAAPPSAGLHRKKVQGAGVLLKLFFSFFIFHYTRKAKVRSQVGAWVKKYEC